MTSKLLPVVRLSPWTLKKVLTLGLLLVLASLNAARADDLDQEPIRYGSTAPDNIIARLDQRLAEGKAQLKYEEHFGFLRPLLRELGVPVSSQMLVYSKTSLQHTRISPRAPRALYFNDDVYVGFCQSGEVLEISAVDLKLGTVFYTLDQTVRDKPRFVRQGETCLSCHGATPTRGLPGHLVRSVFPDTNGLPILSAGNYRIDHTTPLEKRWGGWYVTGTHGKQTHLGNLMISGRFAPERIDNAQGMNVTDLSKRLDVSNYLSAHSDIVALMVMEHQAEGHNLLTRAALETRKALYLEAALNRDLKQPADYRWESTDRRIKGVAEPLVKHLLLSNEAKLTSKIRGTSDFAKDFMGRGPRDSKGRSLRELDLEQRLFKYPCSYLIYSASFEALPGEVKEIVLRRLWEVLNNTDSSVDFSHLTAEDRQAIREILVATKPNLPAYWRAKGSTAP